MKRLLTLPGMRLVWASIAIVLAAGGLSALWLEGMGAFAVAVLAACGVGAVGGGLLMRRQPRIALATVVLSLLGLFAGFLGVGWVIVYAPDMWWLPVILAALAILAAAMPRRVERKL